MVSLVLILFRVNIQGERIGWVLPVVLEKRHILQVECGDKVAVEAFRIIDHALPGSRLNEDGLISE